MQATPMLKAIFSLTALILCGLIKAQTPAPEQDCVGALPICITSYNQPNSFLGIGTGDNEINPTSSCLGAGELNSVWYKIYITTSGNLGFNINPIAEHDYDWAVFNLTGLNCSNIFTNAALEVSCNFSGSTFPTAATGPNNGPNPQDEPLIPVNAGETYYINIGGYVTAQPGYTIDFSFSTCAIDSCLEQYTVDIKETANLAGIRLYPNPAGNTVKLSLPAIKPGQSAGISIYNSSGAMVKQVAEISQTETLLDVTNLPAGLYYYIINTYNGQYSGRFLKD